MSLIKYNLLINSAKSRKSVDSYYEIHHIIPRCLGGDDSEDNLVKLTAKEHYLAHMFLAKEYPDNKSLQNAWWIMCTAKDSSGRDYTISAEEFEEARIAASEAHKARWAVPEFREKVSGSIKKAYSNPVLRKLKSDKALIVQNTESVKIKKSNSLKKTFSDNTIRAQMSEAQKNSWKDPSIKAKRIEGISKSKRTGEIWQKDTYNSLLALWIDSGKLKRGRFRTLAVSKGYPDVNYDFIIKDFINTCI